MIVFQVGTSLLGRAHIMGNNGIIGGEDDWRAVIYELPTKRTGKKRRIIINFCVSFLKSTL